MKYSVLTYIIGNYEFPRPILEKDPEAEYILVTDNPNIKSNDWTVILDPDLNGLSTFDKCYVIRFFPFKYCHTDVCVRMDGNITIKKSLKPLMDKFFEGKYDLGLMPHPVTKNFFEEYTLWRKYRNLSEEDIKKFLDLLVKTRYDINYKGNFQLTLSIERNDKNGNDIRRLTYTFLRYLGTENEIYRLDQTVYTYVMNTWFNHLNVFPMSEQVLRSDLMEWYFHNSNIKNENIFYDLKKPDIHYMFNKEVECVYI